MIYFLFYSVFLYHNDLYTIKVFHGLLLPFIQSDLVSLGTVGKKFYSYWQTAWHFLGTSGSLIRGYFVTTIAVLIIWVLRSHYFCNIISYLMFRSCVLGCKMKKYRLVIRNT
jgi:hypothetical protein